LPELPEVETTRKGLATAFVGKKITGLIVRREGLRYPFPQDFDSIIGCEVIAIRRRAKYLLIDLDNNRVLLSHLGMSGRYSLINPQDVATFTDEKVESGTYTSGKYSDVEASKYGRRTGFSGKHDHFELQFDDGSVAVYTDPRRFGIVKLFNSEEEEIQPLLEILGPEPFEDWNAKLLADKFSNKKTNVKVAILDQRVVVGVGNIYACEALFSSKINPTTRACDLVNKNGQPSKKLIHFVDEIKSVLERAIAAGGSTLNDFAAVDGTLGYFPHQFNVYGREGQPCKAENCDRLIERIQQGGRSTFLCPKCQS
jgi:formamidopyrimidine-DNA glycosylase